MIMLGSYLKVKPILRIDNVEKGLEKTLRRRYYKLIPLNQEAIHKEQKIAEKVQIVN